MIINKYINVVTRNCSVIDYFKDTHIYPIIITSKLEPTLHKGYFRQCTMFIKVFKKSLNINVR